MNWTTDPSISSKPMNDIKTADSPYVLSASQPGLRSFRSDFSDFSDLDRL